MENNQREITHKMLKPELWFLCMTHCLIMLNKCTVEPALRDHAGEAVKVVSHDRWSLKPGFQNLRKI